MINQQRAQALHDKATRGMSLSTEEQAGLEEWYRLQDQEESRALGLTAYAPKVVEVQAQIQTTLVQVAAFVQRLQEIAAENDRLKQENSLLRRQLAYQPPAMQAAA